MSKTSKVILDLCGGTGSWSEPYRKAGYEVINVDILYGLDVEIFTPPMLACYGVLAAPPCTKFSLAAGKKLEARDVTSSLEIVKGCLRIIWYCKPHFWAMENPVGYLRRFMGRPPFTFKQWEFGDMGIKPTDIWGFFNPPRKTVKIKPPLDELLYISAGGSSSRDIRPDGVAMRDSVSAGVTPPGFSKAFFEANQ